MCWVYSVWSCLPFIRSGQNHLARHSERGKKTKQTEEEVGRQHQGMDRCWVRQVPEGSREQGKMVETGCEIICGASRWRDRWWWWWIFSLLNKYLADVQISALLHHKNWPNWACSVFGVNPVSCSFLCWYAFMTRFSNFLAVSVPSEKLDWQLCPNIMFVPHQPNVCSTSTHLKTWFYCSRMSIEIIIGFSHKN